MCQSLDAGDRPAAPGREGELMTDDLLPFGDEQAKAIQESAKFGVKALEVTEKTGGWISDVLGEVPKNLVGVLGGDRLRHYREANLEELAAKARDKLRKDGVAEPQRVSLSVAIPLLEAAAEESRPELQDLWARLLANAMDPKRGTVRQSFINAVKQFDPLDALTFQKMGEAPQWTPNTRAAFADFFKVSPDEIDISFTNLRASKCIEGGSAESPGVGAFGRALLSALG
jgi:hypothetical protein